MPRLAEAVIEALRSDNPTAAIMIAAGFFEQSLGMTQCAIAPAVLEEPASPQEIARLREELIQIVQSTTDPDVSGAAVFALGKLGDPGLKPFFFELLERHVDGDPDVLYQTLIALDNLRANVFADHASMSIREEAEIRALARRFLLRTVVD